MSSTNPHQIFIGSTIQKLYLGIIYFLLYFPILVLVLFSLNQSKFSLQWHGFSTRWYIELFQDHALWAAFLNSILLGFCASLIAILLALFACVHLFLRENRSRQTLFSMLLLLIIIPDIVFGVALLIFFNLISLPLGFFSLLITHTTFCIPFAILTINSRIHTLDPNIYFCALDLGASRLRALIKIYLPLLRPAILSAFLLCFTLSFDDVIISYFVAGPSFTILPLTIYSLVRAGVTPELNALCSVTFLISVLLVITAHYLTRKKI